MQYRMSGPMTPRPPGPPRCHTRFLFSPNGSIHHGADFALRPGEIDPCITSTSLAIPLLFSFLLSFSLPSTITLSPFYTHPKPVDPNHVHHFHWQPR
jgi:hypothetical protein